MRQIIIFCLILLSIPTAASMAQTGRIQAGMISSPKGAGLSISFSRDWDSVSEILLRGDLEAVISGRYGNPGAIGEYRKLFIKEFNLDGLPPFSIMGGPGVIVGFARDHKKDYGYIAGLSGTIKSSFRFDKRFFLEAGFSADIAAHVIYDSRHRNTLTIYRNGFKKSYWPEVSVKYRF